MANLQVSEAKLILLRPEQQCPLPARPLSCTSRMSVFLKPRLTAARAGGITAAGLIAGAAIGSAAQSWLRVDIVPIGVSLTAAFMHTLLHSLQNLPALLEICNCALPDVIRFMEPVSLSLLLFDLAMVGS